jgi:hypothetical protein
MHLLRRILVRTPRNAIARWRHPKALALLLVVVIPGGIVLPIFYGLYGAIRHTLAPKTQSRNTTAPAEPTAAAVTIEPGTRV